MNDIVLNGTFILLATLISGLVTILASRSSNQIAELRKNKLKLEKQH